MISSIKNAGKVIDTIKDALGNVIYEAWKLLTASGIPPLTLPKCKGVDLVDYKIYGNSMQDGTPTPEAPIEVECVGEKTVNLLQLYDDLDQTINGVKIKVNPDKSISVNGTCTANITITIADFDLKQGINYHYSGCPAGGSGSTYRLYFGYGGVDTGNGDSITPSRDISDSPIKLMLYSGQVYENLTFYPMINAKTKSKVYEPYGYKIPVKVNDTITNIYLKEPLRKVGEYKDYIDFINQKVIRNVQELIVTGNETTWENAGSISRFKIDTNRITANSGGNSINQLCNYFVCDNVTTSNSVKGVSVYYSASLNGTFFRIRDNENFGQSTANIVAFFKEKYNAGIPCKILFDLYTPIEEEIVLPNIPTHKGTAVIEIDTSISPSNMEVEYMGKDTD